MAGRIGGGTGGTAGAKTLTFGGAGNIVISDVLTNGGAASLAVTKTGVGTLTLSAYNTYTGLTTIDNGTLRVSGSLAGGAVVQPGAPLAGNGAVNGAVTVHGGGNLAAGDLAGVGYLTLGSLTLGATGGDTQTIGLTLNGGSVTTVSVMGALANKGTTTLNVSSSGYVAAGTYPLLTYSGPTISSGFVLGSKPPGSTLQYSATSIDLVVPDSLKGTGATSGAWDITTTNWQWISTATAANYASGTAVVFDDTLAGNPDITLNTTLTPNGVTLASDVTAYSLSGTGSMAGTNGLTKTGAGLLLLGNANLYSGGTTLLGTGMLALTNGSALGTGTLNLKSARADNLPTVLLSGGITVTNPAVMDSTTGREGFYSTNGNNTLAGPITLTGSNINHLLFQNDGNPGTLFTVSNSISGSTFAGAISLRGAPDALGLVAGQVTINSSFQINGSTTTISGGTLNIGAGGTVGSLSNTPSPIINNGTLSFNRSDAFVVTHEITGAGNVTVRGAVIARPLNSGALGAGTITVGGAQFDPSHVELTGGITLNNPLAFFSRNYPASFPPHYLNVSGTIAGTATGALGVGYKLWASTNTALGPSTGTWTLLSNGSITVSPFTILDATATNFPQRFYLLSTP